MSFISWLITKLGGTATLSEKTTDVYADEYALLTGDIYIREMAFVSATNLISKALSKCEFKTFVRGAEKKEHEWYLWNIEPNKNQNSSEFIQKLVYTLFRKNECLVVDIGGEQHVADSFNMKPYALRDDVFTDVEIKGYKLNESFQQSEVLYFKLSECDIQKVVTGLYESYSKLISYSMNAYQKSKGTKGVFKYGTLPQSGTDDRAAFDALVNEKISKWLNGDNAALPLGEGQEWKELDKKTYSGENTRDIKALIDDMSDFTAKAFGIPAVLLRGDVQGVSDALDNFLTFCIDPLADMVQEEIIRKRYGYSGFTGGNYLKIDTKQVKHVDLLSVSTAIDKLIGSGVFCINDLRILVGEEPIDDPWAREHFITKNYTEVSELDNLEGGEIK